MKKYIENKIVYKAKKDPLVSVVIPTYNRFNYLNEAINSVKDQTYKNFEIIIVNDGSTDKEYENIDFGTKTKVVNLPENQKKLNGFGPGSIRNFGTNVAEGDLLAFLDDDDLWLDSKLEIQLDEMSVNKIGMSSTEGYYCDRPIKIKNEYQLYNGEKYLSDLKYLYKGSDFIKKNKLPKIWDYNFSLIHNCFITSSVIVEKKIFDILGGFRGLPLWADYDCWLGLQQLTDSLYIDIPLVYYDSSHGDGRNYSK